MNHTQSLLTLSRPSAAPDFKKVRSYLRTDQQRENLGRFIKAGWTPHELGEFARQVFLAPGRTYPTAASYQYAVEKGTEHAFSKEALGMFRAPNFIMPPFNRPVPKVYAWDDPQNPEHSPELKADITLMAQLCRNREASWHAQPWPVAEQPIPAWLWRRLFKLRIRYHTLADALHLEGLSGYAERYIEEENQQYDKHR